MAQPILRIFQKHYAKHRQKQHNATTATRMRFNGTQHQNHRQRHQQLERRENFHCRLIEPRIPSACVFPHVLDQKQNKRRHFQATTDKQIPNMDVGCAVCRRVGQIIATPPAANHRFFVGQRGCTLVAGGMSHRKRHRHAKPPGTLHAQSRKFSIKTGRKI